jgi:site-specific recombinase XerD
MYGFILNMWVMRKIDEPKVQSYVPKYITQDEADMILATPQTGTVSAPQA